MSGELWQQIVQLEAFLSSTSTQAGLNDAPMQVK